MADVKESKHILVVDDEKLIREIVTRIARKHNAEVTALSNGKELQSIILNNIFDLAIVDLLMPETSGWDIVDMIRANQKNKNMPIIILSGTKISPDEKKKLLTKVNAVVSKTTFSLQGFECIVDSCSTLA